jgi:hypothetical protein
MLLKGTCFQPGHRKSDEAFVHPIAPSPTEINLIGRQSRHSCDAAR